MANRLGQVRRRLADFDADAVLLSSLPNIRWACGFTGTNGLLFVGERGAVFVTDGRYSEQAREEVQGAEVVIAKGGLISYVADEGYLDQFERVLFQADEVTVAKQRQLRDRLSEIDWYPETNVLTRQVGRKEASEIECIRKAQEVTEAVFDHIVDLLEEGISERDVAAEITFQHLKRGADKMAFDPIVASGPNAARAHARPTDRALQEGEVVVLDMGCMREGYASDMTRTVALGETTDTAKRGYEAVLTAQKKAIEAARAGVKGKELDAVARDILEERGYGDYFSHGLGHGIGLEVHEWPRVSYTVDEELPPGACVTIEPGIYVPEKGFGVRIEDIIVLREDGCDVLTHTTKDLLII